MPIEFRCTQCNKLLRTGDDTAGKEARCPACGTVVTIPTGTAGPGVSFPPPPGANPFGGIGRQPSSPADSGNPYQSPSPFGPMGGASQGAIAPGKLDFADIFTRTWEILKLDWGTCLAVVVIVMALNFGVNLVSGFVPLLGIFIALLFGIWINIGQALFFLKKARGQSVEIGEVFQGGPYFGKILVLTLLILLIMFGILVVCLLPAGVGSLLSGEAAVILAIVGAIVAIALIWYVMLVLSQSNYLILDRNVGVIDSLKMSKDLMEGNKLALFLIGLVSGVLGALLMLMTCGLGMLVVAPYLTMMQAVIYLTITNQPTAEQMQAGPMAR